MRFVAPLNGDLLRVCLSARFVLAARRRAVRLVDQDVVVAPSANHAVNRLGELVVPGSSLGTVLAARLRPANRHLCLLKVLRLLRRAHPAALSSRQRPAPGRRGICFSPSRSIATSPAWREPLTPHPAISVGAAFKPGLSQCGYAFQTGEIVNAYSGYTSRRILPASRSNPARVATAGANLRRTTHPCSFFQSSG